MLYSQYILKFHIIIIIVLYYHRFIFTWYFSWTNGAPHYSGVEHEIVAFSLVCAMFPIQLHLRVSIEYSPDIVCRLFAFYYNSPYPVITVMTKRFTFHIRWNSVLRFLCPNLFSFSFCIVFLSDGTATAINKQILFSFS